MTPSASTALGCLLAMALTGAALPQASAQGIDMSGGGPVEITARGGFEVHDTEHVVIASGDARAVRNDVTVLADQLIGHYRKKKPAAGAPAPQPGANPTADAETGGNELYRLEARGHVRIVTTTDEALGDVAIYDMDQAVLVMTGNALKLTTPSDVITARDTLEYYSQQHMAVARGNAVVVTNDARRIAADILVAYTEPDKDDATATPGKTAAAQPTVQTASATPATPAMPATGDPTLDQAGKLKRVDAFGHVEVRTTADIIRGDKGIYIPSTGIGRVVGHVRITHGSDQTNGPAADFNMKTGVARMSSNPGAQVQGLIVPNQTDIHSLQAQPK